jgi:murein DD-endopeptidase MepM/ murein hydrolase activator NlpD
MMKSSLFILAFLGLVCGAAAQDVRPLLTASVSARSLRPGELLVFVVQADPAASAVRVRLFDTLTPAVRLPDGSWQALVGADLDQKPGHYVATIEADVAGATVTTTRAVDLAERTFRTRRLRVAPSYVNPAPDLLERILGDQAFIKQLYANPSPERLWSGAFIRPVPGRANSSFGTRSVFNGEPRSPHGGTDFLSGAGTPVKAPAAGRIVCARDLFFTGNTVMIDHGRGLFSMLAHLSRLDVKEGEMVAAGAIVGLVGATGRVTGPHLHWALSVSGARVDPLSALAVLK